MANFHHKPIKRFNLNGVIQDDSAIWRLKGEYVRLLLSEMRIAGYVPRFDIDPDFTIDYNERKQCFEFELSIHGVYAGKRQAEWIIGVDVTSPIFTPQSKSSESSAGQESRSSQK
jgi:hypothetical protein